MSTARHISLLGFFLVIAIGAVLSGLDLFQPPPGKLLSNPLLVILLVTATTATLDQRILGSIPVWLFTGLLWTSDHFGWVENPKILALFARMRLVLCAATFLMANFLYTEILWEFRRRRTRVIPPPRTRPPLTYDLRNRKVVKSQPRAKPPLKKAPSLFE